MLLRVRNLLANCPVALAKNISQKCSTSAVSTTDQTEKVVYPPILDLSYKGVKQRKKEIWASQIQKLDTVEEKLIKINMPRYYGWRALYLEESVIPYNILPQIQYITRTHVVKEHGLPDFYNSLITLEELDTIVNTVKSQIEDVIAFESESRLRGHNISNIDRSDKVKMENILADAIIFQINRTLLTNLSSKLPHIMQAQIDFEPRIEAFWFVGGLNPPKNVQKSKLGQEFMKKYADDPIDQPVQYIGSPVLQLRHDLPLKELISLSESENPEFTVPEVRYDPRTFGLHLKWRHGTNIPGFWPGDPSEFGFLSYHNRGYFTTRPSNYNDEMDALAVQAILSSYGWLLSQSCYQGFSTYNDVTYPLVSQTAITNGKRWSFCAYQLNTVLLHSEFVDTNPRRNVCWMTQPMDLYESIENGKVHGLNEDVLKQLIRFYANVPEKRVGVDMKPYLGESVKVVADIQENERRVWLENRFKHLVSNRPRHKRIPEITQWEKIYKIDNNTHFMERKYELWHYGINPMKRRLDDHLPKYIPKFMRENPKKKKIGRWEKTYYP